MEGSEGTPSTPPTPAIDKAELSHPGGPKKEGFTRTEKTGENLTVEEAKGKFTKDQIEKAEEIIGEMTSPKKDDDNKKVVEALKQMATTNPLFKGKRISETVVLRIQAIEALNDVVQNTEFYQNESRNNPNNPILQFYEKNKERLDVRDTIKLPVLLDYVRAKTISEYNDDCSDKYVPRNKSKDPLKRRRVQMEVKSDEDFDLSGAGKYEKILEIKTAADGTEVPKVKRELEADLTVYQVIKRQVVPPETILRWAALKKGVLANEGTQDEQIEKMVAEQHKWDEKIREALRFDRNNPRVNTQVFDKVQEVLKRFYKEGFQAVSRDEETMRLSDGQKHDLRQKAGLSGMPDTDFNEVFDYAVKTDNNRLAKLNGVHVPGEYGQTSLVKGRYEKLSDKQDEEKSINFDSALFRARAFKIVRLLVRRGKDLPVNEVLDEPEFISLRKMVEESGKGDKDKDDGDKDKDDGDKDKDDGGKDDGGKDDGGKDDGGKDDGGKDEDDIRPKNELGIGLVAVKSKIGETPGENREVLESNRQMIARQITEERRKKWEGRIPSLRRGIERFWKHTLGQSATYKKVSDHAVKLLAESGITNTTIPYEFMEDMDKVISTQLTQERTGLRRFTGWTTDKFHALTFTENELEQRRVAVMKTLYEVAFDANAFQNLNPDMQALCVKFRGILKGDYQASQALGQRATREIGGELLAIHTVSGEKRAGEVVEIQGPAREFLVSNILSPLVREGLTSPDGRISEETIFDAQAKMQAFFTSKEFIEWYDDQSAEVKQKMDLSLSYGSDFIPMIQETLIPQLRQCAEHLKAERNLEDYLQNVVLKTRVATLQSQIDKAEIGEAALEKIGLRRVTNESVLNLYRELRSQNQSPRLASENLLQIANDRADLLKKAIVPVGAGALIAVGVAAGAFAGTRMASGTASLAMPFVGGAVVGGALRAAQEHGILGREHKVQEAEVTRGYRFKPDMRRRQELSRFEIHKRSMAERVKSMNPIVDRLSNGEAVPTDDILTLIGYVAENSARIRISEERGISMFKTENPQSYQSDQLDLETAQARARIELTKCINGNEEIREKVINSLHIQTASIPANTELVDYILNGLSTASQQNIETGAGITTDYQAALGNLSLSREKSIQQIEKAFATWRRNTAIKTGLTTTVFAMAGGVVSQQLFAEAARHVPALSELPIIGGAFRKGQTIGEKGINWVGAQFAHPEVGAPPLGGGGFNVKAVEELYAHPRDLQVTDNMKLSVGPDHLATFKYNNGNVIPMAPMQITENKIVVSGDPDKLPDSVKAFLGLLNHREVVSPDLNAREHILSALTSGEHETIRHGNWIIDLNSGPNNQMSMEHWPTKTQIHGFASIVDGKPTINIDSTIPGNEDLKNEIDFVNRDLEGQGWVVHHETTQPPIQEMPKTASEFLKEKEMLSPTNRELWHDNDTPIRNINGKLIGADGKELQFYHRVLPDGKIELDFSKMESQLVNGKWTNWDYTVDKQYNHLVNDIVKQPDGTRIYHNFEIMITPTQLEDEARQAVIFNETTHPELRQGFLRFDTNSNEAKIFFQLDENGKPIINKFGNFQRVLDVEVAHRQPDGLRTILSTSQGEGVVAPPPPPPPLPPKEILHLDPPTAFEFDAPPVPPAPEIESAPGIPFIYRRQPLEAPENEPELPPFPPPTYYGGESLKEAQDWIGKNPQSHKPYRKIRMSDGSENWVDENGQPVTRNVDRERAQLQTFLEQLKSNDPAHYALIESLATQIPAMGEKTRVAVNIPAWMEGKNLYNLLNVYTQQVDSGGNELNPDLYEINIIINRKQGDPPDESTTEIERFKADAAAKGKRYQINYVDVEFAPPFNNVGNARRVITDLTLMRSLKRPHQTGQLYIESEDADLLNVDPKTAVNLITKLDQSPYLDAVRGIQDRFPEKMMENDFLFLYRRMQDFKELLIRRGAYRVERNPKANYTWNRVITGGWNTGYTAEAYALIGGYNPYMTKGEDMVMGERMSMTRGDGKVPNTEVIGKVPTRSDSSPRRYIHEVASGHAAYGPNFEDPAVNAEIRNKSPEELLQRIANLARLDTNNLVTFQAMMSNEYQFIKATTPSEEEAQKVTKLVLLYLGFKPEDKHAGRKSDYEFTSSGQLAINNISNVQQALNDYRTRHKTPRKPGERIGHKTVAQTPIQTETIPPVAPVTPPPAETVDSAVVAPVEAVMPASLEARVELSNSLQEIDNRFNVANDNGEANVSGDYPTAGKYLWQEVTYGPQRKTDGDHCYRGYLMIEPEDMPGALRILIKLGQQQKTQGKRLDFKWLKMTIPSMGNVSELSRFIANRKNIGHYDELESKDPRIAIYGDSPREIQEILTALTQNPQWEGIEHKRTTKFGGTQFAPRRPGTNAFVFNDREYRSLNYNDKQGYSEDEAIDPNWKRKKVGTPTIIIPSTPPVTPVTSSPVETVDSTVAAPVEGLVKQVNQALTESTASQTIFEVTPGELAHYLESIPLPQGAKINDLQIEIKNGQALANGVINARGGNSGFSVVLATSPSGTLQVISHKINPALRHRPFIGQIEGRIEKLNDEVTNLMNQQIDESWETSGFHIEGDKLAFDFRKK